MEHIPPAEDSLDCLTMRSRNSERHRSARSRRARALNIAPDAEARVKHRGGDASHVRPPRREGKGEDDYD
jgi:hypothetical protein